MSLPVACLALIVSGCATDAGKGAGPGLTAAFGARWTPPSHATRPVDGEQAAVLQAAKEAAESLGFAVTHVSVASGKIAAARRQSAGFGDARQDTLEVKISTLSPGLTEVAVVMREVVESGGGDENAGALVTAGLVRDRAAYEVFFARLAESLGAGVRP